MHFSLRCWVINYPEGSCECRLPRGPLEYSFHFIGVGIGSGGFKILLIIGLFETLKMFYPPEGVCSQTPKGSNWILFPFYWCRKRFSGFQKHDRKRAYLKTWKCFILRGETRAYIQFWSTCFYLYIIWVRKCIWHFQNHNTMVIFVFFSKMPLTPEGGLVVIQLFLLRYTLFGLGNVYETCKITVPRWPFFFPWKCFIPQREMRSISSRSLIVFTYVLII